MLLGTDSYVLMAIPLFIIAGNLMDHSGISDRLVYLAKALIGHVRAGLGMVVVVAEMFFSGISGSTIADVSAMATMLLPSMKKAKYPPPYSTSIVAAASAMGILIPPCNLMVILGSLMNVSVAALFLGGFVPALILGLLLMVIIYIQSYKYKLEGEKRASFRILVKSTIGSLIPLGMPIIIFGGILGGICTPTEAAALAVFYAVIVGLFIYKTLNLRLIWKILIDSSVMSGMVMFLIGLASIFSYVLATKHVPEAVAAGIFKISSHPLFFLTISNLVFIVIGSVLEGLPAVIIFLPIFLPICEQLGIGLIHYGILVVASVGIGLFLPPVGVGLVIACGMGMVSIEQVFKPMMIFVIYLFIGLTFLTIFPWFTTFIPDLILK
jgi:tripartite ATP-independent transporter DctM subunit